MAQTGRRPLEVRALPLTAASPPGRMDTLLHSGAVITVPMATGLTQRQSYRDIFAITWTKTLAVFVVIAVYHLTGIE